MVALDAHAAEPDDGEPAEGLAQAGDRKFVLALARGLEVLRAFRPRDGFLGNQEIAERTGLPKPTVSRLTYTLCELGYLMQVPRLGKYQLAPSAITLGYSALASLALRQVARGFMADAADHLAAPIALGVIDRNRALYIDVFRGSAAFTVHLEIGARLPLATTAMGRALIAGLTAQERAGIYERLAARFPSEWPTLRRELEEAVEHYHAHGFVISAGKWRTDVNAVGVPLVAADGTGVFAFNCGGPPEQLTLGRIRKHYAPALMTMVREVDRALSGEAVLMRAGLAQRRRAS